MNYDAQSWWPDPIKWYVLMNFDSLKMQYDKIAFGPYMTLILKFESKKWIFPKFLTQKSLFQCEIVPNANEKFQCLYLIRISSFQAIWKTFFKIGI